jgi:branched-chain amino acid transport system substrate-binding protein
VKVKFKETYVMNNSNRRQMTIQLVAGALALATSCVMAQGQGPIKLGVVNIEGGPFAINAQHINEGARFAVETLNAKGGALGRKYELVVQNHTGSPAAAIGAATRLVEQSGVSFFTGLNPSSTSLAIASKMNDMKALFLDATANADDLTGKNCSKNYFRVSMSDSMLMNAIRGMVKDSGLKTWDILVADYAVGHDFAKKFTALVQENGGSVQKTLFASMAATDVGSYISQLSVKPAEGLALLYPSSAGIALAKQQQSFGLFAKYKLIVSQSTVNETLIPGHGDSTVGVYGTQSYLATAPVERNADFVKAFEARFNRKPSYLDHDAYLSFELIHQAILKAKSTDVDAVRTALSDLKTMTAMGEVEMRAADHQLLRPVIIAQVVKAGEGKAEMAFRSIEPKSKTTAPPSPDCKL